MGNGSECVPITCPTGYYYDGTSCVPYNTSPPPPAPDAAIPQGNIFVHDTQLNSDPNVGVAVRKARMVARRWFKVDHAYTDDNGHFVFNKRYRNKVRVIVKFKNDYASIRGMRGVRLWQMFFAVKKTLGIFSGDKSNILYVAKLTQTFVTINGQQYDVTASNKGTRYWAAATTLNTVQEYRDYATAEQIGLPPTGIRIILSNYGKGSGFTPMYGKRGAADVAAESVEFFLNPLASALSGIVNIFKDQVDIAGSYNFGGYASIRSDAMKELFYHELTHAAHYNALGNGWYTAFVGNEATEIIDNIGNNYAPYGDGTNGNSPQVALGESWAYHIGHYFTDKKYGITYCDNLYDDGQQAYYYNGSPTAGLSSHLNLLENFNPNSATDPFKWIPTGLFYDLKDITNEQKPTGGFVNDNVSNYTNRQMFNAFQSTIYTLQDYRLNLIQQNPNNQSTQITSLFSDYHY